MLQFFLRRIFFLFFPAFCALVACAREADTSAHSSPSPPAIVTHYGENARSMVRIITYDVYGQKIADGMGCQVGSDVVATTFSFLKGAFRAKVNTLQSKVAYDVYGYTACDVSSNLAIIRIGHRNADYTPLDTIAMADTLYSVDYKGKQLMKTIHASSSEGLKAGCGLFSPEGRLSAIADGNGGLISASHIAALAARQMSGHESIYDLRNKTDKKYISPSAVAGFKVETSMGVFFIRLYPDVPEYAQNFVKLVSDGYYDSLLVHRVLPNYLIQTGAADSKYAKADDVVGWQGPGYTLPMQWNPSHFHKRGAVAASKLPEDHNSSNRSDGGQFFVVNGRKFSPKELASVEKEYGKKFSAAQREAYTSIGGAPYLDGDYTVFGEVYKGMDVVDAIAAVPVNVDRPVRDVRIKRISIIKK